MTLKNGTLEVPQRTLFVDCSAEGTAVPPVVPVFNGSKIMLQQISSFLPLSGAAIAHLETRGGSDAEKNQLATVIPPPGSGANARRDFAQKMHQAMLTTNTWKQDYEFRKWVSSSRLNIQSYQYISFWRSMWDILKRPKTALKLFTIQDKLVPALRRVCVQEGGDC